MRMRSMPAARWPRSSWPCCDPPSLPRPRQTREAGDPDGPSTRDLWANAGVLVNELARPALVLNAPGVGSLGEPSCLSLRSLLRSPPRWNVRGRTVYVCENPNLLAIAADTLGASCAPLVCTEGMPAAALYQWRCINGVINVSMVSMGSDVRSNSNLASGLKSRPRNCPYTLVARRSGVRAIEGREFLNDKDAGRNASEPRCSLVNLMRLPTSCLNREGRRAEVWRMEATSVNRRGSRVGMYWKLNCPVLETRFGGGETTDCCV